VEEKSSINSAYHFSLAILHILSQEWVIGGMSASKDNLLANWD